MSLSDKTGLFNWDGNVLFKFPKNQIGVYLITNFFT